MEKAIGAGQVVSAPLKKIVGEGRNYKYVKNCLELHLGGENIDVLQDFDKFENLEVLFLNDNNLKTIVGLEENFRLRRLYLMNNSIVSVAGSLRIMNYLEVLDLSNNHLRNLKKILDGLEHLRFLKTLSLAGNPCCEEPGYRMMVLSAITSLNVLDFKVVTDLERQVAAKKHRSSSNKTNSSRTNTTSATLAASMPAKRLTCLEKLQREAAQIRAKNAACEAMTEEESKELAAKEKRGSGKEAAPHLKERQKIDYFHLTHSSQTKWC